jgi:hypothetical protein
MNKGTHDISLVYPKNGLYLHNLFHDVVCKYMKGYGFKAILAMVGGALAAVLLVSQVSAVTPSLSLVNNGYGTIQVTVYGDANAPVILDYYANGILNGAGVIGSTSYSGTFSATINPANYNIPTGSQVLVVVNGQQSATTIWTGTAGYNNYNNGYNNSYATTPVLSQTSASLTLGQSQTIYINNNYNTSYAGNQYYLSNLSSGIVTGTVNGNAITLYGQNVGSATINVCTNTNGSYNYNYNTSGCATVYVTVTGGYYNNGNYPYTNPTYPTYPTYPNYPVYNNTPISVSNSTVQVTVGNSGVVTLYGGTNNNGYGTTNYYNTNGYYDNNSYYINNNNSNIANATINGSTLTIYGTAAGTTTINVCSSNGGGCASVNVTVIAPTNYYNNGYQSSQNGNWYYSNQQHCWLQH